MGKELYIFAITIKQNGDLFLDFFIQHDGKLLLTGNLKQADVAGLNIEDLLPRK